ncbi:MAG: hypothetical protein ACI96N_002333, partial [Arenicella sp.]
CRLLAIAKLNALPLVSIKSNSFVTTFFPLFCYFSNLENLINKKTKPAQKRVYHKRVSSKF